MNLLSTINSFPFLYKRFIAFRLKLLPHIFYTNISI
nr:MAG TPA: hypothetical protein [Caudoviricetes sp.]